MKVYVEMGVKEFTLSTRVNGFQRDEDVEIALANGAIAITLTGRVESTKDALYGANQTPCTRIQIAITSTNIAQHQNQGLGGATVVGKRSGAQGTIRAGDANKYNHRMVKQPYLVKIVEKTEELVDRASRIRDDTRAKRWFGDDLTNVQLQRIHYDAAALREGLAAVAVMHFFCTTADDVAACELAKRALYKPMVCQVKLGRGFSYQRYSWGEKVCSLAHELSHWFLGTTDETYKGADAYGIKAFDMANDPSATERRKCLKNAENWGYYICSYRDADDGNDWRNMTRPELAARGPLRGAAQLDQAILHAV
jgi:hypothetical protein